MAKHRGRKAVSYLHPSLEPVPDKTLSVLPFQEDIMRLSVTVAGFSWTEPELFRKQVASVDVLAEVGDEHKRFISGAATRTGMGR